MAKIFQHCIFTFFGNLGPFAFGLHMGWLAAFLRIMKDDSEPQYDHPLSTEEISLLGSLLSISMLAGTPMYGILLRYFSCKSLQLLTNILHTFAFGFYLVPNIWVAYCARFVAGVASVGSIVITPLYVNECVEPSFRGILGALCSLSATLGVAAIYILGSCFSFNVANCVCFSCSLLFFPGYLWLPDSPVWLVMRDRTAEAVTSLKKLRSGKSEEIQRQIFLIQEEKSLSKVKNTGIISVIRDRGFRKALLLTSGLMVTQQCTGITAIQLYFPRILETAKSDVDDRTVYVSFGLTQLFGAILGAFLLKFLGRKTILVATSLLICTSHVMFWSILEADVTSSLPFYALILFITAYSIGLGTVPFVMLPELLPQAVRGVAVAVAGLLTGLVSFLYAQFFLEYMEQTSPQTVITTIGCISFLGTLFIIFCLFETKDKTPVEIYNNLRGNKNISQNDVGRSTVQSIEEERECVPSAIAQSKLFVE